MLIISYATRGNYEKELATHLMPSLKKFNVLYDIDIIKESNWHDATHYKATFIKQKLEQHKQPLVFLDVDAELYKYPKLFDNIPSEYDMSVHYLDLDMQWRMKPGSKKTALSGTLYFNYNDKVLKFVDEWIEENKISGIIEQKNMERVLDRIDYMKIYPLPYSYITIITHKNEIPIHMIKKSDVVIIHYQASRRLKRR